MQFLCVALVVEGVGLGVRLGWKQLEPVRNPKPYDPKPQKLNLNAPKLNAKASKHHNLLLQYPRRTNNDSWDHSTPTRLEASYSTTFKMLHPNVGALIISMRFWDSYYNYNPKPYIN